MPELSPKVSPLIVALDVSTQKDALSIVEQLAPHVDIFKVGLQLFTHEGPKIIDKIIERKKRVFVDLKLHDIPNTVIGAIGNLARPGVEFLTVHGLGGREMLAHASEKMVQMLAGSTDISTRLLCVTVLTSLDDEDIHEVGIDHSAAGEVLNLARLAGECGIHGLVASPQEVPILRQQLGDGPVIVTPGVRTAEEDAGDQKRISTPAKAIEDGANYVVMGRSLLAQKDPARVARQILDTLPVSKSA